jgi:hypothetical protein
VNAPELRTQVDLLLFDAFPRMFLSVCYVVARANEYTAHKHTTLSLSAVETVSLKPILFAQVPALDTVRDKLSSFIDSSPVAEKDIVKAAISDSIVPWLKKRFAKDGSAAATKLAASPAFAQTAGALVLDLPMDALFPFLDLWRLGILDQGVASATYQPLIQLLDKIGSAPTPASRATLLTLLRLLSNALGSALARPLLSTDARAKTAVTAVLVQTLLHTDRLVRVAAASATFNVAAWVQRGRVARLHGHANADGAGEADEDGDMEVELVSAVMEAIGNEEESEDVCEWFSGFRFLLGGQG